MEPDSSGRASGLVAILRGVTPERVSETGRALHEAGIRIIEVPLNSPDPFRSIELLARAHGGTASIGAGTVLHANEVDSTHEAGGRLVVAPNCDVAVIERALQLGMQVMPGIGTATEAFTAIHAGATQLKLFPAITYGPTTPAGDEGSAPPRGASVSGRRDWCQRHPCVACGGCRWIRLWF